MHFMDFIYIKKKNSIVGTLDYLHIFTIKNYWVIQPQSEKNFPSH